VLLLGCTHFPPLAGVIGQVAGAAVCIVDSAITTAEALAAVLSVRGLSAVSGGTVSARFLVTDGEERFARVGPVFFGRAIAAAEIERVDL
jgi:glutamate racemase